jgi:hypothetical protein
MKRMIEGISEFEDGEKWLIGAQADCKVHNNQEIVLTMLPERGCTISSLEAHIGFDKINQWSNVMIQALKSKSLYA